MTGRWDGDERGHGVADAARLVPGAHELVAAFRDPTWVAEEPDVHLRPHIEDWCRDDGRLALTAASIDGEGSYVLELDWRDEPAGVGQVRAAVISLIGSFAESVTYVRQRGLGSGAGPATTLEFEVGTGELAPDTRFDPHGHAVVIRVSGPTAAR
jgi:hypothetical protein